jgi:hypothetical protein
MNTNGVVIPGVFRVGTIPISSLKMRDGLNANRSVVLSCP